MVRSWLTRITQRIETAVITADAPGVSAEDDEKMVGLLGAYRAISQALIVFVEHAGTLGWSRLREVRF
jgi:hypothetical protein